MKSIGSNEMEADHKGDDELKSATQRRKSLPTKHVCACLVRSFTRLDPPAALLLPNPLPLWSTFLFVTRSPLLCIYPSISILILSTRLVCSCSLPSHCFDVGTHSLKHQLAGSSRPLVQNGPLAGSIGNPSLLASAFPLSPVTLYQPPLMICT